MESMFIKSTQKVMYICGDFNIDLFNHKKHKMTEEFINSVFSMGLYPTITRPSRITSHSTTLIDNIFTNILENNIESGLLLTDISDHLPIFNVYYCNYSKKKDTKNYKYIRVKTEETMIALKNDLIIQDWNVVYKKKDVDKAYEEFLIIFNELYNKNCPIKKYSNIHRYTNSPWVTKGLQNACKKKNILYRQFLKHRTIEGEEKYKKYKNKLTNIIRICKKDYYNKLVEKNKNNIKGIWTVLNGIVRNGSKTTNYPEYYTENDKTINNMEDVVNGFNQFFVNVGPDLAAKIKEPETTQCGDIEDMGDRNPSTIFLTATDEEEIIQIVRKCKNKTSADWNDIDMLTVKTVIEGIVKPLTHICNLSFQSGTFPDKMKIARVIPLFKTGDRHHFTNYRPVSLLPQFSKILEKLFSDRLDKFIEKHNLLTDSQYGFRMDRSTSMALMELIEEITMYRQ
ncbi:uncharacterized protein LOC132888186 isoform X1 [Neoarius graeffei]|uniref:uncharacterized protein LOC132888186 isoform X1 n=1 Tax=Neoarius graeffei TaxID=443677 RepID=UPI00298C2533|nr:uncharacterized protein LOC132888186 isoform X1 [Neoarius graeffei]XP_060780218.1 uncharacterized protein LOC132888186 isoform X1 [Neoarius graeffei]